ncbi:MAG TPA: hypothetical protein DEQ02_04335 [Ruminococcaceae bacterium]|nr:hypothetical protein [Oscillospiraceae bacterium]
MDVMERKERIMKKCISLLIALAIILTLAACGGGSTTSSASQSDGVMPSSTQDDAAASVEWPDNEWTQQVPKPPFTVETAKEDDIYEGMFAISFSDATYETMKDYVDVLIENGFAENFSETEEINGEQVLRWQGGNRDTNYRVYVKSNYNGRLEIYKPSE